jgi:SAM-dependent methyltransferase
VPRVGDAFAAANGLPFFDWQTAHPDRHRAFDEAMAAGGRMHGLTLAAALDWSDRRRVCDVGGGNGALLRMLIEEQPHLEGVVVDLPAVVADVAPHPRLTVVAGDAFVELPGRCDTYLFVNVLHDWSDDDAVRLLTNAARSLPADGQVIVVEGERAERPRDGVAARTDLLMLLLTSGGRERTTPELAALASRGGLQHRHSATLASADRAHVFTRADGTGRDHRRSAV